MTYNIIDSDQDLQAFCQQAKAAKAIAVDTEFVRTRTLYPKLGLIQLYDGKSLVLVDPFSISNFTPLVELFTDPDVVKVLHSCSEDLETFWHSLQVKPYPIFDTQFAACLLNMGPSLGYGALIETMLDIKLDKGESRTDWLARPLSEQQLVYAANDVLYLWQVYPKLRDGIVDVGRLDWVYTEMQSLVRKKTQALSPQLAYLSMKNNWKLRGRNLYLLSTLAAWRLEEARKRDLALNFVLRESTLVEIARQMPTNKTQLFAIDGIAPQEARRHGEMILKLVAEAASVPPEHYPDRVERLNDYPEYKKTLAAIRSVCQREAERLSVPLEVIGSKKQINQLLKWLWFDLNEYKALKILPDLITGWRGDLLKQDIEQILGTRFKEESRC